MPTSVTRPNDAHRVDGRDISARRWCGEGAKSRRQRNAGPRGVRARKGGRINTDAVDNSAGVDISDHEVNIKIFLLAEAERTGAMKPAERVPLLETMTDDVGRLVLDDNYDQTRALTLAQASAVSDLDSAERASWSGWRRPAKLSRAVEGLPGAEEIRVLREQKLGLTRPELAKLLAYAKIDAFDAIVASDTPDDPHFEAALEAYFPPQVGEVQTGDAASPSAPRDRGDGSRRRSRQHGRGRPSSTGSARPARADTARHRPPRSRSHAASSASRISAPASTRSTTRRPPPRRPRCIRKWVAPSPRAAIYLSCAAAGAGISQPPSPPTRARWTPSARASGRP